MATKKVYDECCRIIRKKGLCQITQKGSISIFKPPMQQLFGIKELVNEVQLMRCSETEKARHLMQDNILWALYKKLDS